ncbi:MAG TPA: copper chaperone PCu(A)C [Xanthobacteraceae bacterium]|nr:copper chaperone PCu(A)C [Xanthobacteraceae bacterium]
MSAFRSILIAAAALFMLAASQLAAQPYKGGNIEVRQPWSRATPHGAKIGAGYLVIVNHGKAPDRLVSASTPAAGKVEVHEMSMQDGVMKMRPLAGGIAIPPGATVTFEPGGLHMMFVDLAAPLKRGQKLTATLMFEHAGRIDVAFEVQGIGAHKPPHGAHH